MKKKLIDAEPLFMGILLAADPDKLTADELWYTATRYDREVRDDSNPEDEQLVFDYVRRAAEKGHSRAQNWMAVYTCPEGRLINPDKESLKWMRLAAAQGDPEASYRLSMALGPNDGLPDEDERLALCRDAAERGFQEAMYNLSLRYESDHGVVPNEDIAKYWSIYSTRMLCANGMLHDLDWFDEKYPDFDDVTFRAAEAGERDALYRVGMSLLSENPEEGYAKIRQAADMGLPGAMAFWANYLMQENAVKNRDSILYYAHKAFEADMDADAARILAMGHLRGDFLERDNAMAWKYLEKGLNSGDPTCQYVFALMSHYGDLDEILDKPFTVGGHNVSSNLRYWLYLELAANNGCRLAKQMLNKELRKFEKS